MSVMKAPLCLHRNNATNASNTSPKLRLKLHRFWGGGGSTAHTNGHAGATSASVAATPSSAATPTSNGAAAAATQSSSKPPTRGSGTPAAVDDSALGTWGAAAVGLDRDADRERDSRRRGAAFAHYDVQSITANLSYAARLRGLLLARRRNTTTGASAASMLASGPRSATPDAATAATSTAEALDAEDVGDGNSNHLLENCPYFRNEVGGEGERVVSLTRCLPAGAAPAPAPAPVGHNTPLHRPGLACGVSVLEFPPGETHWKTGKGVSCCPYQRPPPHAAIESVDHGAQYYRRCFHGQGVYLRAKP